MSKVLIVATFLFAACSDSSSTTSTPGGTQRPAGAALPASTVGLTGGPGQATVDPTVPSWTPRSCIAYHQAVVEALDCGAISQRRRDSIQLEYGAASQRWKAETDATPERIDAVALACEVSTTSVHADSAGKCPAAKG